MNISSVESIRRHLEQNRTLVDAELDRILPPAEDYPPSIHKAMRYSVFAGGKRLRPTLCLEAGRLFGGNESTLLRVGSALELIHTYSLIHDDLPALDNDDLRRGKPTSHVVFGEAAAILAGDALLTLAFEAIAGSSDGAPQRTLQVIQELAHAIGTIKGMVGGQVADLESSDSTGDPARLEYIHSAKTGAFIRAAMRSGAILTSANSDDLARVTAYGEKIGLGISNCRRSARCAGFPGRIGQDHRQRRAAAQGHLPRASWHRGLPANCRPPGGGSLRGP